MPQAKSWLGLIVCLTIRNNYSLTIITLFRHNVTVELVIKKKISKQA